MAKFIKGNYKLTKKNPKSKEKNTKKNPFEKFESKAIKQLGGSIAFVSKSGLLWTGPGNEKTK